MIVNIRLLLYDIRCDLERASKLTLFGTILDHIVHWLPCWTVRSLSFSRFASKHTHTNRYAYDIRCHNHSSSSFKTIYLLVDHRFVCDAIYFLWYQRKGVDDVRLLSFVYVALVFLFSCYVFIGRDSIGIEQKYPINIKASINKISKKTKLFTQPAIIWPCGGVSYNSHAILSASNDRYCMLLFPKLLWFFFIWRRCRLDHSITHGMTLFFFLSCLIGSNESNWQLLDAHTHVQHMWCKNEMRSQ